MNEPRAKRVRSKFTPRTWIRVGVVSAAAFVVAMVGVTAVEFGTNQPISSLVSSTSSIDGGATGHTTTLGKALTGNPTVPDEADESAENVEEVPGQVEEGPTKQDGLTTDGSPSREDTGSAGTEVPGTEESSDTTPADLAPETEQTSKPEVPSDSGPTEQPAP